MYDNSNNDNRRKLPIARNRHTAVHVNGRIIIFGGTCSYPFQSAAQSTFCQYAIGTGEWSKLDIVGYHPLGRQYVQAVPYGDHSIIYFGGFNTHEHYFFSDIFILNTNTSHILKLNPYGMGPCPRRCPGMCLINSNLLVCGGIG
jgi:N-acetylneuraminic acid mutarotase